MKNLVHYYFGSSKPKYWIWGNFQLAIQLEKIPRSDEIEPILELLDSIFASSYPDVNFLKLEFNLIKVRKGKIVWTSHHTPAFCQNSIILTYTKFLISQRWELTLFHRLPRSFAQEAQILLNDLLSIFEINLVSDLRSQIEKSYDESLKATLEEKNVDLSELDFQLAKTIFLAHGEEVFQKKDISSYWLEKSIQRKLLNFLYLFSELNNKPQTKNQEQVIEILVDNLLRELVTIKDKLTPNQKMGLILFWSPFYLTKTDESKEITYLIKTLAEELDETIAFDNLLEGIQKVILVAQNYLN